MSNALRPYQAAAASEIMALLMRRRNPLFVLPTRGGKTRVMTEVTGTVTGAAGWRVGFFVHRVELLKQGGGALARSGIDHGIISPGCGVTSHPVHVASIDTVLARLRAGCIETARWLSSLDLGCLDEAHHAVAGKWLALAQAMAKALLLGVTATPFRSDGLGLGDVFTDAVRGPTMRQLMRDGWLADFAVVAPPTKMNLSDQSLRGRGDFTTDQLKALFETPDFIRAPVRAYGRFAAGQSCVVFCGSVPHAQHTAEAFRRAGWRAVSIDGDTPPGERAAALDGLATGKVQVVTSCELISEGTDLPEVGAAILARPTKSTQLFMQQAGRPLTPHGDKGRALIIDLVRNTLAHGMVDAERPWTLEGGVKGLERQVEGTVRCPTCWRVIGAGDAGRCCPECGNPYPPRTPVIPTGSSAFINVGGLGIDDIRRLPLMRVIEHVGSRRDAETVARILKINDRSWIDRVTEQRRAA